MTNEKSVPTEEILRISSDEETIVYHGVKYFKAPLAASPAPERRKGQRRSKFRHVSIDRRAAAPNAADYSIVPMGPVGATYPAAPDSKQREAQARQAEGKGEPGDAIVAHQEPSIDNWGGLDVPMTAEPKDCRGQHPICDKCAMALYDECRYKSAPSKSTLPLSASPDSDVFGYYDSIISSIDPSVLRKDGGEADFVMRVVDYQAIKAEYASVCLHSDRQAMRVIKLEAELRCEQSNRARWKVRAETAEREVAELKARMKS